MSIPDEAMAEYYRLLLRCETPAELSPRDAKRALARAIVGWLHSSKDAEEAESHFDCVFVQHKAPEEIARASYRCDGGQIHLPGVIAEKMEISRSQARRLIDQGGVSLGERPLAAGEHDIPCEHADGQILKVGKRHFFELHEAQ
jgi:tyrosyl-tRNA synthetase